MKDAFSEYYRPSEAEFGSLWKESIIAFDASAILNLYFYSERTAQSVLAVMGLLKDRIWLPHQAALEYQRNRLGVLTKVAKGYHEAKKALLSIRSQIHARSQPPFLEDELVKRYDSISDEIIAAFDKATVAADASSATDSVRDQLDALFVARVGKAFTDKELATIFSDGKERYKSKVPPGYKDEKEKPGNDAFGDLVIWKELIEKSKADKRSVIFVTDDAKEDWWLIHDERTLGPRPELLKEFAQATGQRCYLYSSEGFLRYADQHLTTNIDPASILELREAGVRDRLLTFERGFEDISLPTDDDIEEASSQLDELSEESEESRKNGYASAVMPQCSQMRSWPGIRGSSATARSRSAARSDGMPLQMRRTMPVVFALDSLPGSSSFKCLSRNERSSASSLVCARRSSTASTQARLIFRSIPTTFLMSPPW